MVLDRTIIERQSSYHREESIEVYRCLLMFGICYLHAMTQCGYIQRGLDNVMSTCVPGFIMISAWFGIRFRPSKMIRIVAMAPWAICISNIIMYIHGEEMTLAIFLKRIVTCYRNYWFVWAYVFLMLFSPLVDQLFTFIKGNKERTIVIFAPIVFCCFAWGWCAHLPILSQIVPMVETSNPLSGMTLFCIYTCFRLLKASGWLEKISHAKLVMVLVPSLSLAWFGIYHHNSIVAFLIAACTFLLFKEMSFAHCVNRIAKLLAPSMFAVYLYHGFLIESGKSWHVILIEDAHWPWWLTHFSVGILFFSLSVLMDMPRRLLMHVLRPLISRICTFIDSCYERWIVRASRIDLR